MKLESQIDIGHACFSDITAIASLSDQERQFISIEATKINGYQLSQL